MEMAEEVRRGRVQLSRTISSTFRPIRYSWLERFKRRHTELGGFGLVRLKAYDSIQPTTMVFDSYGALRTALIPSRTDL